MALCHITGSLFEPNGQPARLKSIAFFKIPQAVTSGYLGSVMTAPELVRSDYSGDVDFYLLTGQYSGVYDGRSFSVSVPDAASADLGDLIDATPVVPFPSWLEEALAARDEAVAAADQAEDAAASLDVQVFATYAAALAYSTANPLAMVFSEEAAP